MESSDADEAVDWLGRSIQEVWWSECRNCIAIKGTVLPLVYKGGPAPDQKYAAGTACVRGFETS